MKRHHAGVFSSPIIVLALVTGLTGCSSTSRQGADALGETAGPVQVFRLTLVTSQPESQFDNRVIPLLSELIEARSKGRIQVEFIGGPELVPAFQALEYLKRGTMDMGYLVASYLAQSVPEFDSVFLGGTPSRLRETGALELLNELLIEHHGVRNLGSLQGNSRVFISNRRVEDADFSGLKMRVTPGTAAHVAKALGATSVTISATEFYTALERGVVDGGAWPIVPIGTWKLNEVARYLILPPYLEGPSYVLLIRESVWQSLPEDLRKVMSDVILQLEDDFFFSTMGHQINAINEFERDGSMEAIVLPPQAAATYRSVAEGAAWEVFKENSPQWGPRFEALLRRN